MFAIKLQTKTFSVRTDQIVRFLIRRTHFMISGAPSHTISQTVFAEHQHCIVCRNFLKSGSNALHSMILIKRIGPVIHHIAQISKLGCRKRMMRLRQFVQFTAIIDTTDFQQLLHSSTAHIGKQRRGNEPVFRQTDHHLRCLERRIPQLG